MSETDDIQPVPDETVEAHAPQAEPAADDAAGETPDAQSAVQLAAAAASADAGRTTGRWLGLATVCYALVVVMFLGALIGELSNVFTITMGFTVPATVIGIVCYFGFGLVPVVLLAFALVRLGKALLDEQLRTRDMVDAVYTLAVAVFVLCVVIWLVKVVIEPRLVNDMLCTLYYACYSYAGTCVSGAIVDVVGVVFLYLARAKMPA